MNKLQAAQYFERFDPNEPEEWFGPPNKLVQALHALALTDTFRRCILHCRQSAQAALVNELQCVDVVDALTNTVLRNRIIALLERSEALPTMSLAEMIAAFGSMPFEVLIQKHSAIQEAIAPILAGQARLRL